MEKNTPFLRYVAEDLLKRYGHDMSAVTVVFPNKRASLFINEHLAALTDKPIWSPTYTTISEMLQDKSDLIIADDIKLVCDLHKSFNQCTGSTETLDQFYGWGTVLLSDFDDIDKCMAKATDVFSNLRDLHAYDNVSYLNPQQIEVLKQFFDTFDENHNSRLQEKFLKLWSHFGEVYTDFNERLRKQGLTYEGALYRSVVGDERISFGDGPYLMVGFNALQEVERQLFLRLKRESNALFYWDFDKYYIGDETRPNEAGTFVKNALLSFPNAFDNDNDAIYDNLANGKHIRFIGAPTGNVQARYVGEWLSNDDRVKAGNKSAVVMCDETLLPTVVHSIPPTVSDLNITTGFPLSHTSAASLLSLLLDLNMYGMRGNQYRQKYVNAVLRHPYAMFISTKATEVIEDITKRHRYYPRRDELSKDDGLRLLFRDLSQNNGSHTYNELETINEWLLELLKGIAIEAHQQKPDSPFDHESIFRVYTLMNKMSGLVKAGDLMTDKVTYFRLIKQVISATRVPYHGEPAVGLQVMGVLETRNLDFNHLLVLSCNEGNMPQGANLSSFIPQSIRKAYGLSTIDYSVSLYAYYFYRMIQRAKDVTIMYVNAADNKNTGEMSRFMLQLMVESGLKIERMALHTEQVPVMWEKRPIEKTPEVYGRLKKKDYLSPTSINRYLRCGLQFYYYDIAGIKEPEDDSDEIDNRIFGTIFHNASMFIYDSITGVDREKVDKAHPFSATGHRVEKKQIENVIHSEEMIKRAVDKAFCQDLFKVEKGESPAYNGLQLIHRDVIVHYLKQLLTIDSQLAPFTIRGLEGKVTGTIMAKTQEGEVKVRVGGYIDRLDEVTGNDGVRRLRVLDYKTGSKELKPLSGMDDVFSPEKIDKHSDYYLQAMLYSWIVSQSAELNPQQLPVSPALLFIQHAGAKDYSPTLKFSFGKGKTKETKEISDMCEFNDEMEERLSQLLGEIYEPSHPFMPTEDKNNCKHCPYKQLCGVMVKRQEN
ncbi:MAG: PD-(D/E)XK nuclease family protein [Prevotella sp.]|nr:PD-(D/E)XK nuclease family protein [Prevotella sp.]